ncbi:anhydro-N-acetylmuramic acid kinase [Cecembia rubra]|uniref:Anhydro-N-acetylmuramic acid kinase n=2 Tax=Cecembia rubra TaxID=1485585 RepID=A0A2P8E4Q2_9BACT|nr:anhydro-N-acetylmuramic acid kinase [Cecembia rubra]
MDPRSSYKMIGLMSGTSGDGLDIAYCDFHFDNGKWSYDLHEHETIGFSESIGKLLMGAHELSALELSVLDVTFGKWMGEQVRFFVGKHGLNIDAVASHGHTVFHQPDKGLSLQIGNGWALHKSCGLPVINDFRMLDVQLGGQGAPLVPIGDRLLFGDFDYCINLGGIANVSMEYAGIRLAFDICPFNLLLNHFAGLKGKAFDEDGFLARSGKLIPDILEQLNQVRYYDIQGSKSLGREDMDQFLDILEENPRKPEDILHTLLHHYAFQIKSSIKPLEKGIAKVLITGGGAFNLYFMEILASALGSSFKIVPVSKSLINYKEALIFAFLGVLRLRGENNCLYTVTGASRDNCGGVVYGL